MAKKNELTELDVDLAPMMMRKGTNAAIVAHVIATRQIAAEADINDPESLMRCLEKYMMLCMEQNIKITNMAAYAACGVSSADVMNWESGRTRKNDPRYHDFAVFLRSVCSQYREQSMVEGTLNPVVGIWHQKIHDGYREDTPVMTEAESLIEVKQDPEEIAAKYQALLDVKDTEEESE